MFEVKRFKIKYRSLISRSVKKEILCSITFENYIKIANTPCVYCNNLLDNNSLFGSGLDRIDNLKGYENENVVSCCKTCNMIKGEVFTMEETKIMVNAVLLLRKNVK